MTVSMLNETSIIIYFAKEIDASLPAHIADCLEYLRSRFATSLVDFVASFTSLMLVFDTRQQQIMSLHAAVEAALAEHAGIGSAAKPLATGREITIPVYYGEEVALDAAEIAAQTGRDFESCVALHSQQRYQVYAVGFSLGFAYLGMLDAALTLPRKATPRLRVPAASVAIADQQTAIYPRATPGGWHIIGRAIYDFGDPAQGTLPAFRIGDQITFQALSREEYLHAGGELS